MLGVIINLNSVLFGRGKNDEIKRGKKEGERKTYKNVVSREK